MEDIKGCMLMAMNIPMLWNIGKPLWNDSKTMNGSFTLGTTSAMSTLILLLQQQAPFVLFLSLTTNLCFIKMINSKFIGGVQAVRLQKQREKVSHSHNG